MEELEIKLINILNNTPLPLEAKVYVIRDLHRLVEDMFVQAKNKKKEDKHSEQMSHTDNVVE